MGASTNFEGFLSTINKRRDEPSVDSRALAAAARHLMEVLKRSPVDQDELVAMLRQQFGVDEGQVRELIAKLLEHEFVERQPSGKLALTPFAEKALTYFRLAV